MQIAIHPAAEQKPEDGYLYVATDAADNTKVGFSRNVERRIKELRSQHVGVELVGFIRSRLVSELSFHRSHVSDRVDLYGLLGMSSEWYRPGTKAAASARFIIANPGIFEPQVVEGEVDEFIRQEGIDIPAELIEIWVTFHLLETIQANATDAEFDFYVELMTPLVSNLVREKVVHIQQQHMGASTGPDLGSLGITNLPALIAFESTEEIDGLTQKVVRYTSLEKAQKWQLEAYRGMLQRRIDLNSECLL